MEARNRTGGHSGGPMGTLMWRGSRLRGAHSLGRVGSLGGREGSVPSQGQARLGAPVTVGGRRQEAWLELPWGGLAVSREPKGRVAAGSVFTGAHYQSCFCFSYAWPW